MFNFQRVKKFFNRKWRKSQIAAITISIILIVSIIVPIIYFVASSKSSEDNETTEPPKNPDFLIPREEWNATDPKPGIPVLQIPIKRVIVAHTGGDFCYNEKECKEAVKEIQNKYPCLDDIAYNFLIGGDGKIYEGRGFNFQGQHTVYLYGTDYNSIGIGVAFIGNYQTAEPSEEQMNVFEHFLKFYSEKFTEDFIILSQDDLIYNKVSANALKNSLNEFENFQSLSKIYRRQEYEGEPPGISLKKFDRLIDWVIVGQIDDQCNNIADCFKVVKDFRKEEKFCDISFNFIIGGSDIIIEGRGWDTIGAHTDYFNSISIGIGVIVTNYSKAEYSDDIFNSLKYLLNDGKILEKLSDNFKINGMKDFNKTGPPDYLMGKISMMEEYNKKHNETNCSIPIVIPAKGEPGENELL